MKKTGIHFFWTLLVVIFTASLSFAAVFEYYGGGIHSQSDSYVENLDTGDFEDGLPDAEGSPMDAGSESLSQLDLPVIESIGSGGGFADLIDPAMVMVGVGAGVQGYSGSGDGLMDAYGNANTVMPRQTTGIFFQILPGPGEFLGQAVNVHYLWSAYLDSYHAGAAAILNSGYDGPDMSITLNEYPSPEPSVNRVWAHGPIEIIDDFFEDEDMGMFAAQIGDIVGIHLGAQAEFHWVGLTGDDATAISSSLISLEIQAIPVPGTLLLLGSGLIWLFGVRRSSRSQCDPF